MRFFYRFFIVLCFVILVGCSAKSSSDANSVWNDPEMWYQTDDPVSDDQIDIFYIVSTEVMSSTDSLDNLIYRALLTEEDRKAIKGEFDFVRRNYSRGEFNLFAPYYHQFNFEAIGLPDNEFMEVYADVAKEVCDAFDYYMKYKNNGRSFALVGFSQGAMLIRDLLRHMSDEQYNQMIAAYMMGFRLSAEDLQEKHIIPADDETSKGVTISFNSVMNLDAAWTVVCQDAVTAINPVNWKTDETPAELEFLGDTLQVQMDEASHLLVVKVPDVTPYHDWMRNNPAYKMAKVNEDCLHRWDLLFYANKIKENIKNRNK